MRNILSKSLQRRLSLIDYLFVYRSNSLKRIENELGYNTVTLLKDISDINEMISPCKITKAPNNEYMIFFPNDTNIEYIYSCFLKNSPEFSLLHKLITGSFDSLESLSTELFISESTLRRLIRRINSHLQPDYHFEISTSPVKFVGDESSIITFTTYFLKEYYLTSEQMLLKDQLDILSELFKIFSLSSHPVPLNLLDADKFNFYVYSTLLRSKQIHRFESSDQELLFFKEFLPLKIPFKRAFNVDLTYDLIFRIELLINNDNYMLTYNELIAATHYDKNKSMIVKQLNELIDYLCDTLGIQCTNYDNLLLTLYNFTTLTYGMEFVLFSRYKFFLNAMTDYYPSFFNSIKNKVNELLSYTHLEKAHEFVYYLLLNWIELQKALYKFNPKMNVGIYFYTDIDHNYWMKQFLKEHFSEKLSITVLYEKQSSIIRQNFKTYDLILTNQPLLAKKYSNVLCCSVFPTEEQLAKIKNFYTSWIQNHI
ncbi:helix-turn-helix domain-containing protein [Enterococcus sp. DIV0242_7C1]|uniref:Mga helix-turn-helix domain-containing protein n=1 Tax=Candidatus Enterococcus dunnyi TaxID=1834192 RepID=A0AAQ3W2G8_9ENTE|nr:helix-turn-helix domain-containing protein [Enterococcus sp. DIV0242_7C1]MBO0470286.1 helix-turn-helix domain-containing protein [Enterococcus sp. DIV0242_7C1]